MDLGKEEQENEEKMEIPQAPGVLSQLCVLEQRARRRAAQEERRERGREREQLLRSKLRELRQRRDRLREKLQMLAEGGAGIPREPREALHWRLRELQELLRLFPLTGVSGKLSGQALSFSLHTSFQGRLLDSFQLELRGSREFRELRIRRHSVPPFIPLRGLARRFLPGRLPQFLRLLLQHLNAFVARRQQLRLLQEEFPECLQGIPSSNSLCNLLSFRCRIPAKNPQIPAKNPQIPAKNPQIGGKNPGIGGKNPEIGGKNPEIGGKTPEIGGKNPEIGGKNPEIGGENPEISGKNQEIGGKNPEIGGENPEIGGKNPEIGGKTPEIGGKSWGNVLEFRARLLYGDPLRSLPTEVEVRGEGGREPPPALPQLLRSRSLPRALRQAREMLELSPGNG